MQIEKMEHRYGEDLSEAVSNLSVSSNIAIIETGLFDGGIICESGRAVGEVIYMG